MRVTVWDRLAACGKTKMEEGFENGASVFVQLETGETIPVEIRVFKAIKKEGQALDAEGDKPQTGLRAIINGQSHAKRDASFFRTQKVDLEHIAGSMLVFIPAVGEFVIPALLGGPGSLMIGRVLWEEFFNNRAWPVASAVAIAMLVLLVFPIWILQRVQGREMGAHR